MGTALNRVLVVGAGIAGAACAGALRGAGVDVTVRERGRAPGGRLASPSLHGRRVDVGAAYFTAKDDGFTAVVEDWHSRGLVRPWTDTFDAFDAEGRSSKSGPQRWATPDGLRSLVRDRFAAAEVDVALGDELTALPSGYAATVLAMPDPQAARLVGEVVEWVEYEPVIAVALGFAARGWTLDAGFVNDDPDITLIADDGARRGDGAPVLVVHTTPTLATAHLDDPDGVVAPVLAATQRRLGLDAAPEWTQAHRWSFAKPVATHGDAPFHLEESLGICGDSWCPSGSPRVESAWLSGHRLGTELAARLR